MAPEGYPVSELVGRNGSPPCRTQLKTVHASVRERVSEFVTRTLPSNTQTLPDTRLLQLTMSYSQWFLPHTVLIKTKPSFGPKAIRMSHEAD